MSHFVDTLAMYFFVDVLASQNHAFTRRMENIATFEDIKVAHDEYLDALMTQSLLAVGGEIRNSLLNLLEVCLCGHTSTGLFLTKQLN